MGKAQLAELEKSGRYFSVPKGISMKPMIRSKQDVIEIEKLNTMAKRYDLVMYIRGEEQGVIHRVLQVREQDYIIAGDNCWQKECIPHDKVVGIAVSFYRNGKWYSVNNKGYRLYARVWTDLFFIRRPLYYCRGKVQSFIRGRKRDKRRI